MKRNVIEIDKAKCVGCGLCTKACHQGAIALIDGKATLVSDSYCDGLGMCLPNCPTDAIRIVEKDTQAFDTSRKDYALKGGCPSSAPKTFGTPLSSLKKPIPAQKPDGGLQSELRQWPVQISLVGTNAPFLDGADLLIAADCTTLAYADFHREFLHGKVVLMGCPKLDNSSAYLEKLMEMFSTRDIRSITVTRMTVPCCAGITRIVKEAIKASGKRIPYAEAVISPEGVIVE